MRGSHGHSETLLPEQQGAQAGSRRRGYGTGERRGETPFGEHFPDALRGALLEVHGDERVALAIFREEAAEKRLGRWPDVSEAQFPFFAGRGAAHPAHGFLPALKKNRRLPQ